MKKLFLAALLATSFFTMAFATDENKINTNIRQNFKAEFKDINIVEWIVRPDFVKATFTNKGEQVEAFYNYDGSKIGTSHHISLDDLSLNARRQIEKKYPAYKVIEALEFNGVNDDAYYVSLENEKEKIILKINDMSTVSLFKKTRKNNFW